MKKIYILFIYLISNGCIHSQNTGGIISLDRTEKVHIIDLDAAPRETELLFSSLFKKVTPIVLETNDEALIGQINSFRIYDGHIYIMDKYSAKTLFVFNMEGRFVRKIGRLGMGPGEYSGISDFAINTDKKEIYLLDMNHRMLKYKPDGTCIGNLRIHSDKANIHCIRYCKQKLYTSISPYTYTDEDCLLQCVNLEDGGQEARFLKTSEYNKGWNESFLINGGFFVGNESMDPKYVQLFMDTVIAIGERGVYPFLALKSKNLVTGKDLDALKERYKRPSDRYGALNTSGKIHSIKNYIEHGNLICFDYSTGSTQETVLYNISDQSTRVFKTTGNDLLYKKDGLYTKFGFVDSSGAYECINSNAMAYFTGYINRNELQSGLANMDKLRSLPEDSNPVILHYEWK
jgi:hypothetical protein